MKNQTELPLWIAVHLLYPNSSQALDIYGQILNSLNSKSLTTDSKVLFLKLESTFSKSDTVRSGQPFRVFESSELKNWKILYKKCLKQPLLIIIGMTVFNFSLPEVAAILKINEEKARFLVNQAFKKLTTIQIVAPTSNEEKFKFKKLSDQKISLFYTHENLVDFCLNTLSMPERQQVEKGLALYPQLYPIQKSYFYAIEELQNLQKNEKFNIDPSPLFQPEVSNEKKINPFYFSNVKKSFLVAVTLSVLFTFFAAFRPISLNFFGRRSGPTSIKLNEVTSQPLIADTRTDAELSQRPVNLREMPVKNEVKLPKTNGNLKISESSAPSLTGSGKAPAENLAKQKSKIKQGGLFRGTILVSDLDTATVRITEKLVALGGRKAGEVELGWRKSAHVSYYHLTLPEQEVLSAQEFLKNFGKIEFEFESHPRLMPAGIKRIILEVKEIE